jgi:hypothetical protein
LNAILFHEITTLATVAATIYAFSEKYPQARIYLKGGSFSRNRLYRMGISNNLDEIQQTFHVYGVLENYTLVDFERNKNYLAFLIVKK